MNDITRIVITDIEMRSVDGFPVAFDVSNFENFLALDTGVPIPLKSEIVYPREFKTSNGQIFEIAMLKAVEEPLGFILEESFALSKMAYHAERRSWELSQEVRELERELLSLQGLSFWKRFIWWISPRWAEETYVNNQP